MHTSQSEVLTQVNMYFNLCLEKDTQGKLKGSFTNIEKDI
jgi:hypothetical protein